MINRKREERMQELENDVKAIYKELNQLYHGDDGHEKVESDEHFNDPMVEIRGYTGTRRHRIRIILVKDLFDDSKQVYYISKVLYDDNGEYLKTVQRHEAKTLRGVRGYIERVEIKPNYQPA